MKRSKTPTFLLELPLQVNPQQAKHLRAHFEAARCLYNALVGEAMKRLGQMRADPRWQQARHIPQIHKQERAARFCALREEYGFSEYALHAYATKARTAWIADHLDSNTAQKLATRAYQAANRVCLGQAKKVRFKSRGRGLDSLEGKTNKQGLRFVLQAPKEGHEGFLLFQQDRIRALIDWEDPVIKHGLDHPIKFVRLLRRRASSPQAQGADCEGYRYYAQLALEGVPYQKPKHQVGTATIGLDLGPSTLAMVPQEGEARLLSFCRELKTDRASKRRLQRQLDRQRRANNPQNYDAKGRVKKGKKRWYDSRGYQKTRRRLASQERKLAVHLDLRTLVPSIAQATWESAETRLRAAVEDVLQRASAGEALPQSMGIPRAGARLPRSLVSDQQELVCQHGRQEALARWSEPPPF
jgi:transposase